MRPVNQALRDAKLAVAQQQLSQIETRFSKALADLKELENQWNKKVHQIQSLGGEVATGLEQVQPYEIDTDIPETDNKQA